MAQEKKPICAVCGNPLEGVEAIAPALHRQTDEDCHQYCSRTRSIVIDGVRGYLRNWHLGLDGGWFPSCVNTDD